MRTAKRLAILPALLFLTACGGDEAKSSPDLSFLDELELAVSAVDSSAALDPAERGLQLVEEAPEADIAASPAKPAASTPARSSATRQSGSRSAGTSPAPAPAPRVVTVKNTKRDAAIGAGAGAVIGATVAGRGERVQGAAIGAVVGGVLGGVIGNNVDKSTRVVYD